MGDIKRVQYGNWVSNGLMDKVLALVAVFGLLAFLLYITGPEWGGFAVFLQSLLLGLGAFFFICLVYFIIARHLFSYDGGGIQGKILDLLVSHIDWDGQGKALDIGCGSGALTIKLAREFKDAHITGIDYWGGSWGYAQKQCEDNAAAEGVKGRTSFQQASASKLPFPDESFDLAVSNLTFHEVKDAGNKREVLQESLRVVKKGGRFVFQDLFLIRQYYGEIGDLLEFLRELGVQEAEFINTSNAPFIPGLLKLPFMVGTISIIHGVR